MKSRESRVKKRREREEKKLSIYGTMTKISNICIILESQKKKKMEKLVKNND